jgi:hypothetical protein
MWRGLIYSNIYVATLSLLMLQLSVQAFDLVIPLTYFSFVFFATLSSYCLHWALSIFPKPQSLREHWTAQNRALLWIFFLFSSAIASILLWTLRSYWAYILPIILLTLAYTLPKVEHPVAFRIRPLARHKTLYLTLVWISTTVVLPFVFSGQAFSWVWAWFLVHRFFHLYTICLLFDFRDRGRESRHLSWAMRSSAPHFQRWLGFVIILGGLASVALYCSSLNLALFLACGFPSLMLWFCRKKPNWIEEDLWYDGVLDGLAGIGGVLFFSLA